MDTNYCNLCDVCPLVRNDSNEYQEIHITINSDGKKASEFESICKMVGGKIISIQLATIPEKSEIQTMSSISFKGSREDAYAVVNDVVSMCQQKNIEVARVKLECSIFHSEFKDEKGYFEGHIAVDIDDSMVYMLREVATKNHAHCSKNAFKRNVYMVTLRHDGSKPDFDKSMDILKESIDKKWNVRKDIREFCYYDSNKDLDFNWTNNLI